MRDPRCGWVAPTIDQRKRALQKAQREAGDSILANVVAALASDNSGLTCNLNQGPLGSCQSNGPAQAMYMAMIKAGIPAFVLARLWLYYAIRYIEGNVSQDVGGNIGDAYRILAANGVPDEKYYPYDVSKFAVWPGPTVDQKAFDSRGIIDINYHPISSVDDVLLSDVEKASTAVFGVVFGHTVSEEFCQTQPNGTIHTPKSGSKVGGGHCQVVVGHDRQNQRFKVKNSWSDDWGDPTAGPGCWWMGYDYFLDSTWGASDCWIVLTVPSGVSQ